MRRARRTGCGRGSTVAVLGRRRLLALRALSRRRRSKGEAGVGEALRRTRAVVITILTDRAASSTLAVEEEEEAIGMVVVVCPLGRGGWVGYPAAQG